MARSNRPKIAFEGETMGLGVVGGAAAGAAAGSLFGPLAAAVGAVVGGVVGGTQGEKNTFGFERKIDSQVGERPRQESRSQDKVDKQIDVQEKRPKIKSKK